MLPFRTISRWTVLFKVGKESIKDEKQSGHPMSATDDYYVDKVKELETQIVE